MCTSLKHSGGRKPSRGSPALIRRRLALLAMLMLGLAAAGGCRHGARTDSAMAMASTRVPGPERTPFDDDAKLRAIFLEWYAQGHALAVSQSEYASPGCLCDARGDERRYAAMAEGFFAGRRAGTEAVRARTAGAEAAQAQTR